MTAGYSGPTQLFIDGKWIPGREGKLWPVYNPATEEVIAEVALAGPEDVDVAVRAARKAFDRGDWANLDAHRREALLHRIADLIEQNASTFARLETMNTGKPLRETTRVDIPLAIQCFRYYAGWPSKLLGSTIPVHPGRFLHYTVREPIGVIAQIIPWNFPLFMAAAKIAPALACGNTVVLKPSELTPLTALYLAQLIQEAGVPDGVVNVINGPGDTGRALAEHPLVDKIAFTGSTRVGQLLMKSAAERIKRISLELGGKSPHIVFADADLDAAAKSIALGIFLNQGEMCVAGSRLFVQDQVFDDVVERLIQRAKKIVIGDPMDDRTTMGALISEAHRNRVAGYVELGSQEGARVLYGGRPPGNLSRGYFYEPTILTEVRNDMRVAQEEIFGPVLAVIRFSDEEEMIRQANDTVYGLSAGVWTKDLARAHRVAKRLKAGTVWINSYNLLDASVPFGGYKQSGLGREFGQESLELYTEVKAVWTSLQ